MSRLRQELFKHPNLLNYAEVMKTKLFGEMDSPIMPKIRSSVSGTTPSSNVSRGQYPKFASVREPRSCCWAYHEIYVVSAHWDHVSLKQVPQGVHLRSKMSRRELKRRKVLGNGRSILSLLKWLLLCCMLSSPASRLKMKAWRMMVASMTNGRRRENNRSFNYFCPSHLDCDYG